jgi:hypothetical protein
MKAYKSELAERCTKEQLHEAVHGKKPQTKPQTKPLSAEDIGLLSTDERFDYIHPQTLLMIVREIEERHGIK